VIGVRLAAGGATSEKSSRGCRGPTAREISWNERTDAGHGGVGGGSRSCRGSGRDDDRGLLRALAPQVLGAVMRRSGDFAAAEDAVQQALIAAAEHWPGEGVPDDPRAWLVRVGSRRSIDHVRAEVARRRREELVVSLVPAEDQLALAAGEDDGSDDTLVLLLMCCHPALSAAPAIALTLRAVGGLTTAEIARAFLVPEATMAQRISRAKQSIKASGVPFELPAAAQWGERLGAVLHVLYPMFNEGYTSSGPELTRWTCRARRCGWCGCCTGWCPTTGG
jgi:RNA polymerase sigma factor (sigma-70 family)